MNPVIQRLENPLHWMKVNSYTKNNRQAPAYKCGICSDQGWVPNAYKRVVEDCACKKEQKVQENMEASGIYELVQGKTFEAFFIDEEKPLTLRAKLLGMNYSKDFFQRARSGSSVAFLGTVGAGKTHLSFAIVNELLKKHIDVAYFPYREEITYLKQIINNVKIYQNHMDTFKKATILLIDDLFKGKVTDSEISILFELINYRYDQNKPMIISSEFTIQQLIAMDEGLGSRILEMTRGNVIQFQEPKLNYRLYR